MSDNTSKFILRLYKLISDIDYPEIVWGYKGLSFKIIDKEKFIKISMRLISKTTEYSAFLRQLSWYGFSKLKTITYEEEFYHKFFQKDKEDLLCRIKRNNKNELAVINKKQKEDYQMQHALQYLNSENIKMKNEVSELKERLDKQENIINGLVDVLRRWTMNEKSDMNVLEDKRETICETNNKNVLFDSDEEGKKFDLEYF